MIKKIIGIADIHIPNAKGLDDLKGVAETFYSQARKIVKEAGGPENVRRGWRSGECQDSGRWRPF